jgi:cytochrome c oxidase subunit 2
LIGSCDGEQNCPEGIKSVRRTLANVAAGLLLATAAPIGDAAADQLEDGRKVFALCAQCHGDDAGGNSLFLAPAIAGLKLWYIESQLKAFRSGSRGLHPEDVAGMRMAPMARTLRKDEDLAAVAAYVASLPPTRPEREIHDGDPERGKAHYALCGSCHAADGAGNQQMNAPGLTHASDWYLLSQMEKFRTGVRGANPGNPLAGMMIPMAMTLPDEQALKDVVAHIMTLSK